MPKNTNQYTTMKIQNTTMGAEIPAARPRFYIHILKIDGTTEEVRIQFSSREMAERWAEKTRTKNRWSIVSR